VISFIGTLVAIFLLSTMIGIGVYGLIVPVSFRRFWFGFFVVPGLGMALVILAGVWLFFLDFPIYHIWKPVFIVSGLAAAFSVFVHWGIIRNLSIRAFGQLAEWTAVCGVLFLFWGLIFLAPIWQAGYLTTPWRTGVDQVGYAETATFLANGNLYSQAVLEFLKTTRAQSMAEARELDGTTANASISVHTNFLFISTRVGFPYLAATFKNWLDEDHVYRIIFLLLLFPTLMLGAVFCLFLMKSTGMGLCKAAMWTFALLLNCNLINVWFEGQYAHTFSAPFALLYWLLAYEVRAGRLSLKNALPLGTLALALLLSVYQELAKANFLILCSLSFATILFRRDIAKRFVGFFIGTHLLASVMVLPQTKIVLEAALYQLKGFKTSGWQQPQWASPIEILGFLDIYRNNPPSSYAYEGRSELELAIHVLLAILLLTFVVYALTRRKIIDPWFWLFPPVFVSIIFVKNFLIEQLISYQYMKSYAIMLPLMFLFFVTIINGIRWSKFISPILVAVICVTGLMYIDKFRKDSFVVDEDMFEIRDKAVAWQLQNYGLITVGQVVREHMIMPFFPMNWLNWGFRAALAEKGIESPRLIDGFNPPVLYLVIKKGMRCPSCLSRYSSEIVFENGAYAFLRTKYMGRDLVQFSGKGYAMMQQEIAATYGDLQ